MAKTKTELRRTCARCDTQWYVPTTLRKLSLSERLTAFGTRSKRRGAMTKSGRAMLTAEVDHQMQRAASVEEAARCPACGSQAFSEAEVRL